MLSARDQHLVAAMLSARDQLLHFVAAMLSAQVAGMFLYLSLRPSLFPFQDRKNQMAAVFLSPCLGAPMLSARLFLYPSLSLPEDMVLCFQMAPKFSGHRRANFCLQMAPKYSGHRRATLHVAPKYSGHRRALVPTSNRAIGRCRPMV